MVTLPVVVPASVLAATVANSSADSSHINPLFAVLELEPSPRVIIIPWSLALAVYPCPSFIRWSLTVKLVVDMVVVSPFTVRSPVTTRLSLTVTVDVLCPKDIDVPDIPVPIATDSLEFAVSIMR